MVVTVKMVGSDVCDDRYVRMEIVAVVKLETADFQHVIVKMLGGHLVSVAFADVASQAHIQPSALKQVIDQGGSGRLSVTSGNTNLLGAVVASGELDFR